VGGGPVVTAAAPDGPRFLSPWAVLRGTIQVLVAREPENGKQTLVYGADDQGAPMAVAFTDPEVGLAHARGQSTAQEVIHAAGFEVVALLPPGCGLWIDPGTPGWTTLSPSTVEDLRPYAVPVPDGVHLVWEDYPPVPEARELQAAVKRVGRETPVVDAVWLLGMQVGDAAREGLVVVGSSDVSVALPAVADAVRLALPDPAARGAEVRVAAFPSLPERVQQLLLGRQPAFTRVGNPAPSRHARRTVDHLATLVTIEEARGNSVVSGDQALVDGRPAVVMKYPLDVDAISLEFRLGEGHELVDLGDRWAVTCAHGGPDVVGGTHERSRLALRLQRTWWKRWNRKPREPLPL
jgi:hypothetical protein